MRGERREEKEEKREKAEDVKKWWWSVGSGRGPPAAGDAREWCRPGGVNIVRLETDESR